MALPPVVSLAFCRRPRAARDGDPLATHRLAKVLELEEQTWSNFGATAGAREAQELIQRMAQENPRWDSMRILGELGKLGYHLSPHTVRRYRRAAIRRPL